LKNVACTFVEQTAPGPFVVDGVGFEPEAGVWKLVLTTADSPHYYCVRMNRDTPEALRVDG
jgi:hypothetical protein